jgi:predicted nucleic acid-binding Zn ribbon protein
MKTRRPVTLFGDALTNSLRAFGIERSIKEHDVLQRWEELVGAAIANHATPVRLLHGTLWVRVEDAAWRHELFLRRGELKRTINDALGMTLIEEVILR